MNNDDNQFFDFLNQYVNDDRSKQEAEFMQVIQTVSRTAYGLYSENINNGFSEDQSMEIVLEYVRDMFTNGGN